jgi:oxaloacetate decarboxylase beta subunit
MGPNVAGVIGSAVAAGVFISLFGDPMVGSNHAETSTNIISTISSLPK